MPDQLRPVECPQCIIYVWEYWLSMSSRRTNNGFSQNPIPHEGVEAWERRRRIRLLPFENVLLDAIESVFLRIVNKPKPKT